MEKQVSCPKCGAERINNSGLFCSNSGVQLIDVGDKPGAFPVTGELEDQSEIDIHCLYDNEGTAIEEQKIISNK